MERDFNALPPDMQKMAGALVETGLVSLARVDCLELRVTQDLTIGKRFLRLFIPPSDFTIPRGMVMTEELEVRRGLDFGLRGMEI